MKPFLERLTGNPSMLFSRLAKNFSAFSSSAL